MKPIETGPLPFKAEPKYKDPFLEAIARNPRPLSMVLIGVIGMPLVLWIGAPSRTPAQDNEDPRPVYESSAMPVERVSPVSTSIDFVAPANDPTNAPFPATQEIEQTPNPVSEPTSQATNSQDPQETLPAIASDARPSITLIIDDIGYNVELGERAIALPGAITFAILPHTPHGSELAELAYQNGKEIMLHAPMSNQANMALGPGALTNDLDKEAFTQTLSAAIDAVPHLQGVNNHMGSALTELEIPMTWVMETLKERGLYFVDSYTTSKSVAGRVAKEHEIPTLTRNIFLDNVQEHDAIDREFKTLIARARSKGVAVGIGHPYQATIDYLEVALPILEQEGIDLIFASQMIALQKATTITDAL